MHVGLIADAQAMVDEAHAAAMAVGASEIYSPGPQLHCDPRYYAAQVRDPDGNRLALVFTSWQHED